MLYSYAFSKTGEDDNIKPTAHPKFRKFVHASIAAPRLPMLSAKEERRLFTEYHETKSARAMNKLVQHHLPMVNSMAFEYASKNGMLYAIDDMLSEGLTALLRSIERFKQYRKGARLNHFARYHIQGRILTYMLKNKLPFEMGTSSDERVIFFNRGALEARFAKRFGHAFSFSNPADLEKMSELSGSSVSAIRKVYQITASGLPLALDQIEINDHSEFGRAETQIRDRQIGSALTAAIEEVTGKMRNERSRAIFLALLDDETAPSRQDLAAEYGVTPERVGQIYREGLADLRIALKRRGIDGVAS